MIFTVPSPAVRNRAMWHGIDPPTRSRTSWIAGGVARRGLDARNGVPTSGVAGLLHREDVAVADRLLQRPQEVGAGRVLPVADALAAGHPAVRLRRGRG